MIVVDDAALDVFRRKRTCEWCGRPTPGCDPHHFFFRRGMGGGSRLDHPYNLVGLCRGWYGGGWRSCHEDAEANRITRRQLLELVARREGLTPDHLEEELYRMWRISKWTPLNTSACDASTPASWSNESGSGTAPATSWDWPKPR